MALAPSAAWLAAAEKTPNEPRVLLTIYDGSSTWRAVDGFCDHTDFAADDQGLLQYSPLSEEVDPFTRECQIGSVSIDVADAWIRPIAVNNRLMGKRVTLQLGWKGIAETDYISLFRGAIETDPKPRPGGTTVVLDAVDIFTIIERSRITGYWTNLHPLEVAQDIIEKSGVPTALIDYDSMTPSGVGETSFLGVGTNGATFGGSFTGSGSPVYKVAIDAMGPSPDTFTWRLDDVIQATGVPCATTATTLSDGVTVTFAAVDSGFVGDNWLCTCSDALQLVSHFNCSRGGGHHHSFDDFVIRSPASALGLLNQLAVMLNGMWARNEDGQIRFLLFDSTATAADAWDDSVIGDFTQLSDDNLVNEVIIEWLRNQSQELTQRYEQSDTDSQSAYAFPGNATRVVSESVRNTWLDHTLGAINVAINDAVTTCGVITESAHGFTGCRWPDFLTTSQADWCKVSATNPAYFKIGAEIVRVTSLTPSGGIIFQTRNPDTDVIESHGPYPATMTINTMVREVLGTTAAAHNLNTIVYDMTIPYYMATKRIARFSTGVHKVEVTTPLSKAWLQFGDLVTLEHAPFLAYGLDGLEAGDAKWEICLKEVNLYDAEPHCRFILVDATEALPALGHSAMHAQDAGLSESMFAGIDDETVARPFVSEGLNTTVTAGLVASTSAGTITNGMVESATSLPQSYTFTASKDTYVTVNLMTGGMAYHETALGAGTPALYPTEREVAKVVTGAAGIDSISMAEKPTTAISGAKVIDGTAGIVKLDLAQQYSGTLNANAALTMYSNG